MERKEMTTEYRLAHWEQVMHDRKESGMSIKDYCESAGFPENRHFYRQRRLRATTCREIEEKVSEPGQALVPQGWSRVNVSPFLASPGSLPVEIGLYRVQVSADTDVTLLTKICKALISI